MPRKRKAEDRDISSSLSPSPSSSVPPSPQPPAPRRRSRGPAPMDPALDDRRAVLLGSFLEIAAGQSPEVATQFLEATGWDLDDAIQLYYAAPPPVPSPPKPEKVGKTDGAGGSKEVNAGEHVGEDGVRAPLPVFRDTLYGMPGLPPGVVVLQPNQVVAFRDFEQETRRPAVWDGEQNDASKANGAQDSLASLYRPPYAIMYRGLFEQAKFEASSQGKWLLINLQSTEEFASHMLNRDTWGNEALAQTIRSNFIFWQAYHDTAEGKKVCTYYHLYEIPAILVIDPITGQRMRSWNGMIEAERLLEELLPFLDKTPKEQSSVQLQKRLRKVNDESAAPLDDKEPAELDEDEALALAISASLECNKKALDEQSSLEKTEPEKADTSSNPVGVPEYLPLPEEPKVSRDLLCRVGIRLPDGRRVQRSFLRTDPVKLLWSFCCSQVEDGEKRPFHFMQAIPGAPSGTISYDTNQTFEEAGLLNSMVNFQWD